jgi:penicillin-binding protein 1A
MMDSLLQEEARSGTAARAQATLKRPDLYGKTGTTNDAVDAWFAGFQAGTGSRGLVAVVWMGHGDPQSLGARESGGGLALPVWIDYMAQALKGQPVAPQPAPPGGLAWRNDDWVYAEFADGGGVNGIGLDEPGAPDPAQAASAVAAEPAAAGTSPGRAPGPPSLPGTPAGPGAASPARASAPQAPMPAGGP